VNATTHAVFGIAALAGAALVTGADPPAYVYPAAVIVAWLPDIDNPRSTLGNGLNRLKNPTLDLLSRPLSWALRTTSFVLIRTVGHRTMTHSLAGVLLFSLLVLLFLGLFRTSPSPSSPATPRTSSPTRSTPAACRFCGPWGSRSGFCLGVSDPAEPSR
jgi:membrane-bound metal-dependent hydrolase YbcI (DUF457 family)